MKDYLALLKNVPGVVGTLLCARDGSIVENSLPAEFDPAQVRKIGLTLHHGVAGLEEGRDNLGNLEFVFRDQQILMWVTDDHLLLVLTEKELNRAVLDRSVRTFFEHLLQKRGSVTHPKEGLVLGSPHVPPAGSRGKKPVLRKVFWFTTLALILAATGVFALTRYWPTPTIAQQPPVESVSPVTIFRMQGSNTIGARLAPTLAAAFLKAKGAVGEPVVRKTSEVDTLVTAFVAGQAEPLQIEISAHGSTTAFAGLLEKKAEIGMASRPIKPKEVEKLAFLGNLAGPDAEQVLAMDGLAVVIHPGNRLRQLDNGQLAELFSGVAPDWSRFPDSGLTGSVHVYARDDKSGTYDTFKSLILKPNGVKLSSSAKRYEDSNQLSIDVSKDPQGIGFIGLPYIKPAKAVAVSDAGVRAIYPNSFTVATEDYSLSRRLFLYLPPNTDNLHAREFVSFALSEKGQKIVREVGFIDLLIAEEQLSETILSSAPDSYRNLTRFANRLSLNFRFLSGSNQLDSKALQDIQRLVEFLQQGKNRSRGIRLLGFTDSIGDREQNCRLSLQRAKTVADVLNGYGIYPRSVDGLCDVMPVASNASPAGREKNRRVEAWVEQ
jgi:phosphate transport system substrate-binding protein